MLLTPKHIIFVAVSNYLPVEQAAKLKTEISSFKRLPDLKFIKIIERYFDFNMLRDKPVIPEDIWLFNYLMYENKKKVNQNPLEIGDRINFKGRLLKKGLILKYETKIVLPQLKALLGAQMILTVLNN